MYITNKSTNKQIYLKESAIITKKSGKFIQIIHLKLLKLTV